MGVSGVIDGCAVGGVGVTIVRTLAYCSREAVSVVNPRLTSEHKTVQKRE